MSTTMTEGPRAKVVSPAEWLVARKALLKKEKEFTHLRDDLSRQRRELPWVRIEKSYVFEGAEGKQSLSDLFRGRNQLIVYHFMFGPGWKEGCPSCSFIADQFDSFVLHLAQRDTSLAAVSRATWPEIAAFKKRMGWQFRWVSSSSNDFNFDFHVSFSKDDMAKGKVTYNFEETSFPSEEAPGVSVFYKRDGEIFHTYSTFSRGLDIFLNAYNFLDLTPKGRDEASLPHSMAWVRHHDRYENNDALETGHDCCSKK